MMNTKALNQINQYGRKRLADQLKVSPASVTKWLRPEGRIPAERVLAIERLTGVPRYQLRRDIYPRKDYLPQSLNGGCVVPAAKPDGDRHSAA